MEQVWNFRYALPPKPDGELVELSAKEMEGHLLRRLEEEKTY